MKSIYTELKERQPEMFECFFAFSQKQFAEGMKRAKIGDKNIYPGGAGLYGTSEGIKRLFSFYDALNVEIAEKYDPQEVYDNEYYNHECGHTGNDEEAIKLVISYFGEEKAKTVKRKHGYIPVDEIKF